MVRPAQSAAAECAHSALPQSGAAGWCSRGAQQSGAAEWHHRMAPQVGSSPAALAALTDILAKRNTALRAKRGISMHSLRLV